ncbi:MAG: hypothetical protein ABSA63_00360 [Thermoplasmata archaeon]
MSSTGSVTVVCRATPSLQRQWYTGLARLIACAPPPAAALFETTLDGAPPRVTVRPAEVIETLRRSVLGRSVGIENRPSTAPAPPASYKHERTGFVVRPRDATAEPSDEEREVLDRVGIAAALTPDTWLGLQTFWLPSRHGGLWVARRFRFAARSRAEVDRHSLTVGTAVAAEWSLRVGLPATFRTRRLGHRRDWRDGGSRTVPPDGWFERSPELASRAVAPSERAGTAQSERPVETPAIVLGASGAGKTTYLARWGARVVGRQGSLVVLDVHGDLAPAILDRLTTDGRRRVVAVDATLPPVPGIAALVAAGSRDRAAAHLVAALKRLSPDGTDLYWGFRLERIFDTFVRLAFESGGSLTDLYDLLTNPDRRDAARLATRTPELGRFLDELAPVVRRNPEFLWSAATRLSKVALVPALRELLAPEDGGLAVEALLEEGRSLLVRLPFASLGPEASSFAATLVLGRVYLGVAAAAERRGHPVPVAVLLDEVHAFSPRLVAEILTEGRKFGLSTVVATQYPDRLSHEVQSAARGALRGFVAFRVPRPSAKEVGAWLGLRPEEADEVLPSLPTGEGLVLDSFSDGVRSAPPEETAGAPDPTAWRSAVETTRREFAVAARSFVEGTEGDALTERLLLAVLSKVELGVRVRREELVAVATALPGDRPDPALLSDRLVTLEREGYLVPEGDGLRLTAAGERRLGLTVPTGATRETAEHRALLIATFRLFARRGYRLEILRQGRFDTTLPDARLRQLPDQTTTYVPSELAAAIELSRRGWAWRFFRGRDVHVEAEVSGALRAERIRHGVRKALHRGAFVLFVVGDAHRARRVRSVLATLGLGTDRAQVWTLRLPPGTTERPSRTNP